ncbi:RLF2 [Candida metapsilosis]|uniref:RLF2 n=1 Tax=Candida metapsilosis TaxID=273372 RepID=A0A8H7ZF28_9ASCO|nr:RLF2 [Candida metapsilosis]
MTSLQTQQVDTSEQLLRKSIRIDEASRKRKREDESAASEQETVDKENQETHQLEKLAKKQKMDQEKEAKRLKLEEEKRAKAKKIEEEKEAKRRKLEEEKEAKRKKIEQEKLEKERKKMEEKLEREKKKELEKLERERKKQAEQAEKERKKREEQAEKERKKQAEQAERERKKQAELAEKERKREEREKEKLEKKLKQEEEKRAKELEKQRIEEEKRKAEEAKERSQMKISNFFHVRPQEKQAKEKDMEGESKTVQKSDYETEFLPFFVQRNVTLKQGNYCTDKTKSELDSILSNKAPVDTLDPFVGYRKSSSSNPQQYITPEAILNALNLPSTSEQQVLEMIEQLPPIKYISFYENSKPPYTGSWCSQKHQDQQMAIISDPLDKEITGLDYDYDSDLEWNNEEKDGEDIDDEEDDEEDISILPDEDDDEFIEKDSELNKRSIHQLVVVNKWNNEDNKEFFHHYTTSHIVDLSKLKSFI